MSMRVTVKGENDCEHCSGKNNTQGDIVGIIPLSHVDDGY
jgi:hypothetical protein